MTDSKKPQKDFEMNLDAILDYEMDELEALAYKLTLLWLDRSRKVFPDYEHTRLRKGDPRKSLVFKVCYKLARETQGVLDDKDYPLYIRAQLEILKHINVGKTLPLIDTNCLVGDKAWKRWKLWKSKYDSVTSKPSEIPQITAPGVAKAILGLENTKEFITKTFGPTPSIEKYQEAYLNKNIFRWINFAKISPYYLTISPYIQKILQTDDFKKINFDPSAYKACITEAVLNKFKELFNHEYGK